MLFTIQRNKYAVVVVSSDAFAIVFSTIHYYFTTTICNSLNCFVKEIGKKYKRNKKKFCLLLENMP